MKSMHRRAQRGKAQTMTSARSTTRPPAALDAAGLPLYGLANGHRVSGAGLCELLLVRGGD